ncbi:hypothetical protein Hypma_005937 [Hypsizygus marmoreus]|uniref:Uncharacterized protein n=1 Tax=Hypsizygus marmoreus TaxID=39966 RepID=A0A369K7N8_HYPMA|nr:hypothetical protein Hypma_005937 [Hypsizygus marmoreus]
MAPEEKKYGRGLVSDPSAPPFGKLTRGTMGRLGNDRKRWSVPGFLNPASHKQSQVEPTARGKRQPWAPSSRLCEHSPSLVTRGVTVGYFGPDFPSTSTHLFQFPTHPTTIQIRRKSSEPSDIDFDQESDDPFDSPLTSFDSLPNTRINPTQNPRHRHHRPDKTPIPTWRTPSPNTFNLPARGHSSAPQFGGKPSALKRYFEDVKLLADSGTLSDKKPSNLPSDTRARRRRVPPRTEAGNDWDAFKKAITKLYHARR